MVHSGSASPMKTTPSASPHLSVVAAAPSLQAAPLVPHPGDTTDQDLTRTPARFHSTDLTFNSDLTQPCTLTPADAEQPVVVPAKALAANSSPASSWLSAPTPTPAPGPVNGRTSGRKRTPKACDCCGPKGTGHNARTSGRGRGRGRGRAARSELSDTQKRKARGQLTQNKSFDLTKEKVDYTEVGDDRNEKVQATETHLIVANTQSQIPVSPPVSVSVQGVPIRSSAASVKGDVQNKEGVSVDGSVVAVIGENGGGSDKDVDMRSLGGTSALKIEVESGIKRRGLVGVVNSPKTYALPELVFVQRHGPNSNADVDHEEHPDPSLVKSPFGNGDTVNLSDTEPEEEANGENMMMTEMENGLPSFSQQSGPASESGSSQDLDSEMQVDQTPDKTNSLSVSVALSNGSVITAMNEDCATFMEAETSRSAMVTPPCQGPITISLMQHCWALRDHRLYCQPGTWEENETEGVLGKDGRGINGKTQGEDESLEQLIDLIHEFLESFYLKYGGFIPLSETDVLEYLKKKGNPDLSNRGVDIKREMTRYRAGLASAPIAGFMVTYNRHTLGLEDLSTLEEQNWLNDQVINMYGELIMEATQQKVHKMDIPLYIQKVHFFNSFFHKQLVAKGYDGVKRWTKKVDLFSKWLLLIPIHLEIHWSLVTVTMATKTISYYDSQGIVFRHTTDNIMKYLLSEAREKKQTAFQKGWKITIIKGIPQQKNDSDCGVFVLEYCRRLSVRQPLLFSQEDMPSIRKRIYKELCECRLND